MSGEMQDQSKPAMKGLGNLVERITPWHSPCHRRARPLTAARIESGEGAEETLHGTFW
jgi:hypothetical protein